MLENGMQGQEDRINKMIGDIVAHRAKYPHQVSIPQPSRPWESQYWVSERDSLTYHLGQWVEGNGMWLNRDYSFWHDKTVHMIVFGFKDPKHAVMFKLAHGGNV